MAAGSETQALNPVPTQRAQLVENAVDSIVALCRLQLNPMIMLVQEEYEEDGRKINLTPIPGDRFYVSEKLEPYEVPACFVLADASEHDLDAQNWEHQVHDIMVGIVLEDSDETRLTRKRWRYGRALWATLHDKNFYNVHILATRMQYDILFGMDRTSNARRFRADIALRLRVHHFERQAP